MFNFLANSNASEACAFSNNYLFSRHHGNLSILLISHQACTSNRYIQSIHTITFWPAILFRISDHDIFSPNLCPYLAATFWLFSQTTYCLLFMCISRYGRPFAFQFVFWLKLPTKRDCRGEGFLFITKHFHYMHICHIVSCDILQCTIFFILQSESMGKLKLTVDSKVS